MLGSGWYLPVVLSGLSGKFADRNGIYYPTAEMINGGLVYKARHKGLILQYTAAKNWKVSPLSDKGSDKGCAFIAAPNPSRPIERVPGTWQVWNDTDKKWEAKAEVKVCSEAEAEASANAEAEASAKAEAEALLGSGRYLPVVLSGLSAPYADRNGIYDPTAEIIKGGLVYKARHGDYILQYSTIRSWMVTDLSDKGTDMGYAFIAAHPPSQPIELTTARAFITSTGFSLRRGAGRGTFGRCGMAGTMSGRTRWRSMSAASLHQRCDCLGPSFLR